LFFNGILAGCTNENSICWIILVLLLFVLKQRKERKSEFWMYSGLAGLALGYAILMFAPGNYVRLIAVHGQNWFTMKKFYDNLYVFILALIWQFILWYFCIRSMVKLYYQVKDCEESIKDNLNKDILLVKVHCFVSMGMTAVMIFSPEFHLRSAFPGTVMLIIATGILVRIQNEYGIELLKPNVKKFLSCVGIIYFVLTASVSFHHVYVNNVWNTRLLSSVSALKNENKEKDVVLCVEPLKKTSRLEDFLSGFRMFENNLSEDPNSWENVAFARYYSIKGIRILNGNKEGKKQD
jgi:hypothetical protein